MISKTGSQGIWQDTVVVPASFGKIGRLDLGYPIVPGKQLWFRSIDDWMNLLSFRLVKRVVLTQFPALTDGGE